MFEIEGIRNKRVENCHDCSYAQDNNLYLSSVSFVALRCSDHCFLMSSIYRWDGDYLGTCSQPYQINMHICHVTLKPMDQIVISDETAGTA